MKIKSFITLTLLFVLGFSIIHEYAFTFYDNEHCTVTEYVAELEAPSNHGDICDIHFEYHQAFVLSSNTILPKLQDKTLKIKIDKESYNFQTHLNFLKPPIV